MKAMILAAGLGSRLKPITDTIPKAMVPLNGKPLLQHHIEQLIKFGVTDIIVNVHHFASKIIDFIGKHNFDANIIISDESNMLLDTGGGIKKAARWLEGSGPVLIQNVDVYSNIDYEKMLSQHRASKALATIAVRERETTRYLLFNENNELCGWQNTKTNEEINTRPSINKKQFGFSCIHIVSEKLFGLLPENEVFSIVNLYLELSKKHIIKPYMHNSDYWFDIGTPEKLKTIELFFNKYV